MSFPSVGPVWQLPVQLPQAAHVRLAEAVQARTERLLKGAIVLAMLALTVLDRFGVRVLPDYSIPPALIALYGLVGVMLITGVAGFNSRGFLAYTSVVGTAALSYVVNASFEPRGYVSLASFLLLAVVYAPFAVSLRANARELWGWTFRLFIAFSLLLAIAGIGQFFAQFVLRPDWLFDYTPLIPEPLRASGAWNTVNPVGEWVKSNGFFIREASMFSILAALAFLCELSLARRVWVMAILGVALVLTYSGSGLVCLAAGLLFPLGRRSVARVLSFALIAVAAVVVFGEALNLSYTVERVNELQSDKSSAYCRFVYPGAMVLHQLEVNPWASLVGHGPGSMARMGGTCADLHQPTYGKLAFEYGLLGILAFGFLMLVALRCSAMPSGVCIALVIAWLVLGGNLLAPEVLLLIYLLSAMWAFPASRDRIHEPGHGRSELGNEAPRRLD